MFTFFKSLLTSVFFAIGQFFAWLNRRDDRKDEHETRERLAENLAAAAKPSRESADRLNLWIAKGLTDRLRRSDPARGSDDSGLPDGR